MIGHGSATFPHSGWGDTALHVVGNGHLGVSIFFVISGFLITTLLLREMNRTGGINLGLFYVRRAFRILPPCYAYIATIAALAAAGAVSLGKHDLLAAATFVWNYVGGQSFFLGHLWSLSVEEQFYLAWPILLAALKPRRAAMLAIAVIAVSPCVRVATYLLAPEQRAQIGVMGHTRVDTMMFGCLAALWYSHPRFHRAIETLNNYRAPLLAAAFLAAVTPFLAVRFKGAYMLPFGQTLEGLAICLAMLWTIRHPAGGIGRVLNCRPVVAVGVLSYSLYLWQQLFLTNLNPTISGRFPINFACCFALALTSFYLVERPSLRLRQRLTGDRKPAGPGI